MCASEEITALIALGLADVKEVAELAQSGGLASGGRLTNEHRRRLPRPWPRLRRNRTGAGQLRWSVSFGAKRIRGKSPILDSGWRRRWAAAGPASSLCWAGDRAHVGGFGCGVVAQRVGFQCCSEVTL